ncbi:hypothetical protein AAMO2058_001010800 [Amorphochlora amoebiformis]
MPKRPWVAVLLTVCTALYLLNPIRTQHSTNSSEKSMSESKKVNEKEPFVVHIVLFKTKKPNDPKTLETLKKACEKLRQIKGVLEIRCGPNYTLRGKGYNFGLYMRFESKKAEAEYQVHPVHKSIVKDEIKPLLDPDAQDPVIALDFSDIL